MGEGSMNSITWTGRHSGAHRNASTGRVTPRIVITIATGFAMAISLAATATAPAQASGDWDYAPEPPGGAAPGMTLPARTTGGDWATPNQGVPAGEALFHVRAALNVAALGCRGMHYEQALIDNYNALQLQHKAAIAAAERAVIASRGVAARDRLGTKLYNYFATPPVQAEFCPVAFSISKQVRGLDSLRLKDQAPRMLWELEQPFQRFYTAYSAYADDLKAWRLANGGAAPRTAPSASYAKKKADYDAAMRKYEADKAAYAIAYKQWQEDVAACQRGDRARCAPVATQASRK